ncbi:MAG: M48 family metallopeptidase [Chlorobi bacterium]|nr:M48 family metallopeptidase [Chlorobiota bacterium]
MKRSPDAGSWRRSVSVPGLFYTLRVSSRAVHPRLKMVPHEGLHVVVPCWYPMKRIEELLFLHRAWIAAAEARIERVNAAMDAACRALLPESIIFHCTGEQWRVSYREQDTCRRVQAIEASGRELVLSGRTSNPDLCRSGLRLWLRRKAGRELLPILHELARGNAFRFEKAAIRMQKSRWGSCSSKGVISLNSNLLFLPYRLSESVMLHELCHTVHLDHSRSFRELLDCHDPLWREHDRELKSAWQYIPRWVTA